MCESYECVFYLATRVICTLNCVFCLFFVFCFFCFVAGGHHLTQLHNPHTLQTTEMQTVLGTLTKDSSLVAAKPALATFKAEALVFKATSASMSQSLDECVDLLRKREEVRV